MPLSESDTRAQLIHPAIHTREWTEDLIWLFAVVRQHLTQLNEETTLGKNESV